MYLFQPKTGAVLPLVGGTDGGHVSTREREFPFTKTSKELFYFLVIFGVNLHKFLTTFDVFVTGMLLSDV